VFFIDLMLSLLGSVRENSEESFWCLRPRTTGILIGKNQNIIVEY
jgi:hypothetical protein